MNSLINEFKKITGEMLCIFQEKNKYYGNSFFDDDIACNYYDIKRKWNRIKGIFRNGKIHKIEELTCDSEDIKQNLIDLANYSIMTLMNIEYRKQKTRIQKITGERKF